MVLVAQYADRAKSVTTDQRPEFQQMVKDAAQKRFDVVIVHKLDRFARNRYDSAHYRHQLKRNGLHSVQLWKIWTTALRASSWKVYWKRWRNTTAKTLPAK